MGKRMLNEDYSIERGSHEHPHEMDEGCGDGEMYEGGCGGEMYEDDATWTCKNGKCTKVVGKGGVGDFETLQDCEDSNCEERARPGGYGGRGDVKKNTITMSESELISLIERLVSEASTRV